MKDCIEWAKSRNNDGYGQERYNGKTMRAHRAAWIKTNGFIPDGLYVLHKCDNRACVNIDHLYLGTQKDNMRDARIRGRYPEPKHGTIGMYTNHRCRCIECKKVRRDYERSYKTKNFG